MQPGSPLHSERQALSQLELEVELAVVEAKGVQRPSAIRAHTPSADWSASNALASAQLAARPIGQSASLHRHSKSIALPEMR